MKSQPEESFYPKALDPALIWLRQNSGAEEVILAEVQTSQLIAQKVGRKVYIGHPMETLFFDAKRAAVGKAYQQNFSDSVSQEFPVDWIIYGPYEQIIAPDFDPGANLILRYQNEGVEIYQVVN